MIKKSLWYSVAISIPLILATAHNVNAQALVLDQFDTQTQMKTDPMIINDTWNQLKAMGTTSFLGGVIGNFKLDESSMIAGALTLGSSEFDNFLRTGALNSSSGLTQTLMNNMQGAAGLDLSKIIGSYTSGGGNLSSNSALNISNTSGASSGDGVCDPKIAQNLVDSANKRVEDAVSIASGEDYGFSSITSTTGGTTGFAGLSCLDKLFQNAGADIFFKPPSLDNLSNQITNWVCNASTPIAEQVAGAFPSGFDTAVYGGFVPTAVASAIQDDNMLKFPGVSSQEVFGNNFGKKITINKDSIKKSMNSISLLN